MWEMKLSSSSLVTEELACLTVVAIFKGNFQIWHLWQDIAWNFTLFPQIFLSKTVECPCVVVCPWLSYIMSKSWHLIQIEYPALHQKYQCPGDKLNKLLCNSGKLLSMRAFMIFSMKKRKIRNVGVFAM